MKPTSNEPTISSSGTKTKLIKLIVSTQDSLYIKINFEIAIDIEKIINPIASSKATTGSNISTKGPLALYWWITIRVAAGAVAVATAPRHNAIL